MVIMASIGAAGVPGVGLILLAGVLASVGLPAEGIALILGVERRAGHDPNGWSM